MMIAANVTGRLASTKSPGNFAFFWLGMATRGLLFYDPTFPDERIDDDQA
jgi:hypothetical protein